MKQIEVISHLKRHHRFELMYKDYKYIYHNICIRDIIDERATKDIYKQLF